MARYRLNYEDTHVIGTSWGTLWERPIIDNLLRKRLPDHSQDHLPLSDCCCGTIEWTLSDPDAHIKADKERNDRENAARKQRWMDITGLSGLAPWER